MIEEEEVNGYSLRGAHFFCHLEIGGVLGGKVFIGFVIAEDGFLDDFTEAEEVLLRCEGNHSSTRSS